MKKTGQTKQADIVHMRVKRGDRVVILTGKDKGSEGKILLVDRKNQRVIVEGKNMITRHQKQNARNQQGGLIKKEASIHVSNVMLIHNGQPTRVGFKVERKEINGRMVNIKYRVAKKTGEVID
jgi:large subunit ribosomal protein L24